MTTVPLGLLIKPYLGMFEELNYACVDWGWKTPTTDLLYQYTLKLDIFNYKQTPDTTNDLS